VRAGALHAFRTVLAIVAMAGPLAAETVEVEFRGDLDLGHFRCTNTSSLGGIGRVCYDEANRYMVVREDDRWRHFCEVEAVTAERFLAAPAMDRFFGSMIEGRHDCKPATVPKYE
jgi:hypothetical protein